jgi:hypothetical protein
MFRTSFKITDLVPRENGSAFESFDDSRAAELDMGLYRQLLASAMECFAYQRAMSIIRPKQTEHDDPEYSPASDPDSGSYQSSTFG